MRMHKPSQKTTINLMLIIALVILTSAGVNSFYSLEKLRSTSSWVQHTYQILARTRMLTVYILRADLKARDYILSENSKDLDDMKAAELFVKNSLIQMMQLTQDNPIQTKNFEALAKLDENKDAETQSILDTFQNKGREAALTMLQSGVSNKLSENIINFVNEHIIKEEVRLLHIRQYQQHKDSESSEIGFILGTILSDFLLIISFIIINHFQMIGARAERSREELENHLRIIIDGSSDLIAAVDTNLNFTAFNRAYSRKFQAMFNREVTLGTNVNETLSNTTHNQEILNSWQRAVNGDELILVNRWAPNDESYYEITFNPIHDGAGNIIGAMHVMRDISERMKVDRMKNEFVSIVSHELRTPLTSIRGSLGLLVGGAIGSFDEKTKKMLNIAYSNSERLIRLINDILDIEKIEIGKIDFQLSPLDIQKIIEEAMVSNQPYCEKFNVTIKFHKLPGAVMIFADYGRIMQVLTNLISNAVKFSPTGAAVTINVSVEGEKMRVTIVDHGEGIPTEFQSQIFQKFAQADPTSMRKQSGTGLGLSICKAIIEKLNGSIGFTTEHHQGSTFFFELPLWREGSEKLPTLIQVAPTIVKPKTAKQANAVPLKILYVEDDLDLSQIVLNILSQEAELVSVQTTHLALEALRQQKFDLVLLDLVLPDGYGADLIPEVTKQQIPIVIFSAYELPQKFVPFVAKTLIKSKTTNQELIQTIRNVGPNGGPDQS
jgi:PAS domain S-box-containing protein